MLVYMAVWHSVYTPEWVCSCMGVLHTPLSRTFRQHCIACVHLGSADAPMHSAAHTHSHFASATASALKHLAHFPESFRELACLPLVHCACHSRHFTSCP